MDKPSRDLHATVPQNIWLGFGRLTIGQPIVRIFSQAAEKKKHCGLLLSCSTLLWMFLVLLSSG
jgi:hypothetical protein